MDWLCPSYRNGKHMPILLQKLQVLPKPQRLDSAKNEVYPAYKTTAYTLKEIRTFPQKMSRKIFLPSDDAIFAIYIDFLLLTLKDTPLVPGSGSVVQCTSYSRMSV